MALKELSARQEQRLILYLDDQLSTLSNHFETRNAPRAVLPTLEAYLEALSSLQTFILAIPPVGASAPLRVNYLLNLTSLLPDVFSSYPLPSASLTPAFAFLSTFDEAWLAVLSGHTWDASLARAVPFPPPSPASPSSAPSPPKETGVRGTDRVRLESIVRDLRDTLRAALGLPLHRAARHKLDQDGRNVVEPFYRVPMGAVAVEEGQEGETRMSCAIESVDEGTPELATDASTIEDEDEVMRIETEGSDSDDDEGDFEEVDVASPGRDVDGDRPSFSIHFQPPPPPPLSTSTVREPHQTPSPTPEGRKGFDPDTEYGTDEDDGGGSPAEETDGELLELVDAVFKGTMARLEELKLL